MNKLPFEIAVKLIDLLSIRDILCMATVNHYWNTLATWKIYQHPIISSKQQLDSFIQHLTPHNQGYIEHLDLTAVHAYVTEHVLYAFQWTTHLRVLNLSHCVHAPPAAILPLIRQNTSQLQALTLVDCTLSTEVLRWIGEASRQQLGYLSLRNTMIKPCKAIDATNQLDTMLLQSSRLSRLRELDLSFCCWVNEETVENIAHRLPYLEHILLQWCNQIKASSIHSMVKQLACLNTMDIRHSVIDTFEQACHVLHYTSSVKKIVFTHKATSFEILT